MSIITQALKKAQREQSLHRAPTATPRASASRLLTPRAHRPWSLMALGGVILLGTGACIYIWFIPRPSASRAMLASTSQQLPLFLSAPLDEPAHSSLTALEPQVTFRSPFVSPGQVADRPLFEAALEPTPSPSPAPSASQATAIAVTPALPLASQTVADTPLPHAQRQAKRRFNEALEAHASQNLPQAEQLLLQAIALNPDMKSAYTSLGNLYYERQDYARAIAMYQHTLSIEPKDINARNNLGSSYLQLAMHDEAIAELRKAIDVDSTSGLAYYNLACAYARTGAKIRAVEYLQQAIERAPQARDWARTDRDFASVRSAPAFQKLLGGSS